MNKPTYDELVALLRRIITRDPLNDCYPFWEHDTKMVLARIDGQAEHGTDTGLNPDYECVYCRLPRREWHGTYREFTSVCPECAAGNQR